MVMFAAHPSYEPSAVASEMCTQPVNDIERHPQANRTNSKGKSGAHEDVAGKGHIYGMLPNNLLSFLI